MAKAKDLSPKLSGIKPAEIELEMPLGQMQMGQNLGGLSVFSNTFKRGYGSAVFGSDENGIWLGAADFIDAPFRVNMQGEMDITDGEDASYFSAKVLIFYNDDVPEIVIGDPSEAPD